MLFFLDTKTVDFSSTDDEQNVLLTCQHRPERYIKLIDTYSIVTEWTEGNFSQPCADNDDQPIADVDSDLWDEMINECNKRDHCTVTVDPVLEEDSFSANMSVSYVCVEGEK